MALLGGYLGSSLARFGRSIVLAVGDAVGVKATTISANATFDETSATISAINGGASNRDVTAVASCEIAGMIKVFLNTGTTNNLVIKSSAGSTLATLTPGQYALIAYGAAWHAFAPSAVASAVTTLAPTTITLTDNQAAALDVKEGSNVYLRFVTTDSGEKVTVAKPLLWAGGLDASTKFASTEQTGTGSSQNVAHGLSSTPSLVWIAVTEDPAGTGFDIAEGTHDSTNIVVTVTSGVKFKAYALK